MFTCRKAAALLSDFTDKTLSPDVHDAMSQHLRACRPCMLLLETYQATQKICRQVLQAPCPAELGERLLAFLRREIHK